MNVHQLYDEIKGNLLPLGAAEAESETKIILAGIYGCSLAAVLLQPDPTDEQRRQAGEIVQKRGSGMPLQYILGEAYFMGRRFVVTPDVLIPRADTEPMTEYLIEKLAGLPQGLVADVCCGSGAIGIAMAEALPKLSFIGSDISVPAVKLARENAGELPNIEFFCGDLCAPLQMTGLQFDMIVSNPPYVTDEELKHLPAEVYFEPRMALAGGRDGMDFYRRLALEAPPLLKQGGYLAVEIGCLQKAQVKEILQASGELRVVKTIRDLGGRPRAVIAKKD